MPEVVAVYLRENGKGKNIKSLDHWKHLVGQRDRDKQLSGLNYKQSQGLKIKESERKYRTEGTIPVTSTTDAQATKLTGNSAYV